MNSKLNFIFSRRSVRVFQEGEISDSTLQEMLEAAMAAPSAVAKDPWRFVVIRNRATLNRIANALPNGKMLPLSSLGIAVCGDLEVAHDQQLSYLLQDCSAAIENFLLAAHVMGLGTCWLGVHPREDRMKHLREVLLIPQHIIPVAMIAVGHPGEEKEARTRYNPAYIHHEKW
jgi:nitroreductase